MRLVSFLLNGSATFGSMEGCSVPDFRAIAYIENHAVEERA